MSLSSQCEYRDNKLLVSILSHPCSSHWRLGCPSLALKLSGVLGDKARVLNVIMIVLNVIMIDFMPCFSDHHFYLCLEGSIVVFLWVQVFENKSKKHPTLDSQEQREQCSCKRCVSNDAEGIDVIVAVILENVVESNRAKAPASTDETIDGACGSWIDKWDNSYVDTKNKRNRGENEQLDKEIKLTKKT